MNKKFFISALLLPAMALTGSARDAKGLTVYINP